MGQNEIFESLIQQLLDTGYGVADGFLSPGHTRQLAENLTGLTRTDALQEAGIGKHGLFQKNETIRKDRIHWLDNDSDDPAERAFLDLAGAFSGYLNRTCFTAIRTWEFHYALYEKGSFYRRHLDQFQTDAGRKFSIVTYLNEDWQAPDGGELVLYLPTGEVTIAPMGGRLVFFKSDEIEHEVKLANRERRSVTGWLKG